ncbi:dehydrogenase/reductase SDR family member 11-like [Planococcus citri]|uniref:dehydrogenase/reductase SDR family member 11-like n=1 Tax=Planococcus citri TaxID=170843 RepID=UPI0031F9F043
MDKWRGKGALVTGANSGIGAAVTRKLLELGMVVAGLDRQVENLNTMKLTDKYGESLFVLNVDLSHEEEILRAFQWAEENIGGVDVLVNSAGIGGTSTLLDGNFNEWHNMLNINVIALSLCAKEAVKSMRKRNVQFGHIIHLSSNAAHIVPEYSPFHFYSATKHAVKALTEGLRQELRNINSPIRVTSISPGIVKTPIIQTCLGDDIDKIVYEKNPYLQTEDIASAVEYILSTPTHVQIQDLTIKPLGANN